MIKGIGASPGIAIGFAKWVGNHFVKPEHEIWDKSPEEGLSIFKSALSLGKAETSALRDQTAKNLGEKEAGIFDAHLMMLEDPEFIGQIEANIKLGKSPVESLREVTAGFVAIFSAIEDAYLKERAADLKDIGKKLEKILLGQADEDFNVEGAILLAEDLSPSDTAKVDKAFVQGFLTVIGGTTSHSAIMARTIGLPAIVGIGKGLEDIAEGTRIAFDGDSGELFVNPDEEQMEKLLGKKAELEQKRSLLEQLKGKETKTLDGVHVEVACNIGGVKDLKHVLENDGEGIGLFRSEFLYMDRENLPSEEEQFEAYSEVLKTMAGKPVVIRTLDVGGDKNLPYLKIPKEENPFLGFRAIRYCLKNEEVFITQIKALLRAGVYGNLRIMMPMISGLSEVRAAKVLIEKAKAALISEEKPFSTTYQLGIMIEIPSAAIIADLLAKEVDFFSIGTNDLIQYTVAVDRMNQDIAELYTPFHPSVIRLIANVISAGKKEGIWVGMCGEAAGNLALIPLLLGLGLDEFSMNPSKVLAARQLICSLDQSALQDYAEKALLIDTPEAMKIYLENSL